MLHGEVYTKPIDLGQLFSYVHCKIKTCKYNKDGACSKKIIHTNGCQDLCYQPK